MSNETLSSADSTTIQTDVLIIGGGLAGLACAATLQRLGVNWHLLEASDRLGGRVATDEVDGFLLDRGFQVLLSSYEEVAMQIQQEDLPVSAFACGALLPNGKGGFDPLLHPLQHPTKALASLITFFTRFGWASASGLIQLLFKITLNSKTSLENTKEESTATYLSRLNLPKPFMDQFLTPFFGGVFLETALQTSVRKFLVLLSYFAKGRATLPQGGMQALPQALAKSLPSERLHLNCKALPYKQDTNLIQTEAGQTFQAKQIILATELNAAAYLLQTDAPCKEHSSTCWYFAAPKAPVNAQNSLYLAPQDKTSMILHWCYPGLVEASYSSSDEVLVSVSTRSLTQAEEDLTPNEQVNLILAELETCLSNETSTWRFLKHYKIKNALPASTVKFGDMQEYKILTQKAEQLKVTLCGDYTDFASINGALRSGRRAALACFKALKQT